MTSGTRIADGNDTVRRLRFCGCVMAAYVSASSAAAMVLLIGLGAFSLLSGAQEIGPDFAGEAARFALLVACVLAVAGVLPTVAAWLILRWRRTISRRSLATAGACIGLAFFVGVVPLVFSAEGGTFGIQASIAILMLVTGPLSAIAGVVAGLIYDWVFNRR